MRRILVFLAALALVIAACSSSDSSDTTTTTAAGSAGSETSTTTSGGSSDTTTTTTSGSSDTTTTQGGGSETGLYQCIIGTWQLDSDAFFEAIKEVLAEEQDVGDFESLGGEYLLIANGDGTFSVEQRDWGFLVTSDFGELELVINSMDTGTWSLDGDVLSTTVETLGERDIQILVDGVPFEFPGGGSPIEPPEAEFTGAVITCDGDLLTATDPTQEVEYTSVWTRVS